MHTQPISSELMRICYFATGKLTSICSTESVLIGRDLSCDLWLADERIQPAHAEIYRVGDLWWVRDLGSIDGTYLDEECVEVAPVVGASTLQLGAEGPVVWLDPEGRCRFPPGTGPAAHPH